ncbi:hypothetical protein BASA81_015559 [Batrachochytrium salamandrivorans]|nr:hypothetical protein BASA81_015559 [Batrachochytrium salamandrivorans]
MKLISFAAISLLAITVSAWPPNSPSAQDIQESQDSTVRSILQILDSPDQGIQYLLNSPVHDIQQQSRGSTAHNIQHQSQDNIAPDIQQQYQDSLVRGIQQILESPKQDIQRQPQGYTSQDALQYQGDTAQNTLQYQDDIVQDIQKYHEDIAQDIQLQYQNYASQGIQQPQEYTTQGIHHFLNYIAQDIPQSQNDIVPDIPQQSQDGATQSAQQSDRDKVQTEIDRLKLAFDVQDHQFSQIDNYINSEKQKVTEIQAMIRKGTIKLQGIRISMDERLRLQQNIYDLRMLADELTAKYRKQYHAYIYAMTERGTAKAELQLLRYNQKLIAEYNADHEVKVRISPNSFYNIYILKIQYADILKHIDKLLVEQKAMRESTRVFGGNVFRGQSEELENAIRALQIYSGVARGIVWQHKYGQSIGEWSAEYLNLYLWNGQI